MRKLISESVLQLTGHLEYSKGHHGARVLKYLSLDRAEGSTLNILVENVSVARIAQCT